ncbi:ribosomal RNA large subunit methyltransferase J [Buchnera aphidicola str. Bp (Baizongia pistaciae)]|uniref:Ribosomal RNA large subunit methyltransferase E n=2 Tax=Buchnera aphidicola TaxID=9 RepID=RLME_BUCBP|nr:RecName: Full=Ribosomal RNA large subunit methyltransferase E; AltName: Full=23S rRNA Um2552 methyltransferase; AltName: Full=rRNA (uridine-2'-O-)-methyltransferase [Buchnera aphidicola str. Bp (Baizongia pistaciae)]AAO27065.1 ribosomal RNA large subunit methyltransferase J [Buchnera aphidicola str. Bp (Baizongia pistaciae)]
MSKKRSSSSNRWLNEHFKDKYVKQVHKNKSDIRSRAWFKLDDIQSSNNFLKVGMTVVDLGSSPGSWSGYAVKRVGKKGRVIACDMRPMLPIKDVVFFQGNIKNKCFFNFIETYLCHKKVHVIISDMAPNMTGHYFIDHIQAILLSKLALKMSIKVLSKGGSLLVKSFYGQEFNSFIQDVHVTFSKVKICKPNSSRARSREVYILASGRKM